MGKLKEVFTNWRILLVLFFMLLALLTIKPNPFVEGVAIKGIVSNSASELAGIQKSSSSAPMNFERIISLNNHKVLNSAEYYSFVNNLKENDTLQIQTNKGIYRLVVKSELKEIVLNETEQKIVSEFISVNETINETVSEVRKEINKTVDVPKIIQEVIGVEDIGLRIDDAPSSNIRKGLDLQGGSRVLLRPVDKIDKETTDFLIDNIAQRLNVYGLSDVIVTDVTAPGENERLILVEIA